jgi:protein phosphatase 4 regulatory subunit 3
MHKANYREFLSQNSHYHQPIPIQDQAVQRKIHHTYRLQFLKDVVLARALDDSTFNVLNSCIIFNQIDIITHVQQDVQFLREVVRLYVDEDMLSGGGVRRPEESQNSGSVSDDPNSVEGLARRREVIHLIQQLCAMGKNVQLPARMALFRSLVDRGILFAVQWALAQSEADEVSKPAISAGGEILSALLDHDLVGVRGHILKHVAAIEKEREVGKKGLEKAETLLQLVCRNMAQSKDLAIQSQIGDALRSWLDLPSVDHPLVSGEAVRISNSQYFPRLF